MRFTGLLALGSLLGTALLTGCGDGSKSIDDVKGQPNSFPPATNALDDFQPGSTGDSSNSTDLGDKEVLVTLEVPGNLAPTAELTRRNLRIVAPDQLSVYRSDNTLRQLASVDYEVRNGEDGRRIVNFPDGVPQGPDVIIEARYGNAVLRALAADSDRDIKINPFSEYLVSETLAGYTGTEFDQVMDCVDSDQSDLCINKFVWPSLADLVHDFEIDIPANLSVPGAVDLLAARTDFAGFVDSIAQYALFDSSASGSVSAASIDYNSVFLGMELGRSFLESSLGGPGQWGVRIAKEERLEDENGVSYIYPGLTLTSFELLGINVTSLAGDIPYDRETLLHTADQSFFSRGTETWRRNSHASAPGAATLQDDTRLVGGRALFQSVTGRGSSRVLGWTRNPYYQDAYVGGGEDDNDQVLMGYFSGGKAIRLKAVGEELKRQDTVENHFLSALEINLRRTTGFQLGTLDNRRYNVVSFVSRFDQNRLQPLRMEAATGRWAVNGGTVAEELTTRQMVRDNNGQAALDSGNRNQVRTLALKESIRPSGPEQTGRLSLDSVGVGASSPDGALLAFNLDDSPQGDGLIIAGRQIDGPAPSSGRYRLQGFVLGLGADDNRLRHFQNSVLTIASPIQARLAMAGVDVSQRISSGTLNSPAAIDQPLQVFDYTDLGDGQVRLRNGDLVLEGFVTGDHDSLFLTVQDSRDGVDLGLVIATRQP